MTIDAQALAFAAQALDQGASQFRAFKDAATAIAVLQGYAQYESELLARVAEAHRKAELAEAERGRLEQEAVALLKANEQILADRQRDLDRMQEQAAERAGRITTEAEVDVAAMQVEARDAETRRDNARSELVQAEKRLAELRPALERAERIAQAAGGA